MWQIVVDLRTKFLSVLMISYLARAADGCVLGFPGLKLSVNDPRARQAYVYFINSLLRKQISSNVECMKVPEILEPVDAGQLGA